MHGARVRSWLVVAGVAALGGCTLGQSAASFKPAQGPRGVWTELRFSRVGPVLAVAGELLAVPDSGLYVLTRDAVPGQPGGYILVFSRWAGLESATFDQMGLSVEAGRPPSWTDQAELAEVSRFPQGISPRLLKDLLAAYNLEDVFVPDAGAAGDAGEE